MTKDSYLRLLDLLRKSQRETAIACALAADLKHELSDTKAALRIAEERLAELGVEVSA